MTELAAPWTVESAYAKFLNYFNQLAQIDVGANEAETRLKIIDTVFFEILDWSKSDVEVEKYCREVGFSDYVFTPHETITLVIEAKRAEVHFTIPNAKFKADPVCFALLETECKESKIELLHSSYQVSPNFLLVVNFQQEKVRALSRCSQLFQMETSAFCLN